MEVLKPKNVITEIEKLTVWTQQYSREDRETNQWVWR